MRIVSLLPSATELIAGIGLADRLVGVSHSCDYPGRVAALPVVTRTMIDGQAPAATIDRTVRQHLASSEALYSLDVDLLARLAPDLVVSQALCDVCAVSGADATAAVEALPHPPVLLNLEPFSLADVLETGGMIGKAAGVPELADRFVSGLRARIDAVGERTESEVRTARRVAFLDWVDPPFAAGHWMNDLITLAGGVSVIDIDGKASRTTSWEEIDAAGPEAIVIACCGFDVKRTLAEIEAIDGLPARLQRYREAGVRVHLFDGNALFSRAGPRLVESLELLAHRLHPGIHPTRNWFGDYL